MEQQSNSSAGLFSARPNGENQTLLKPASSLATHTPSAPEAGEADWERLYTPNELPEAEDTPRVHIRRSRLVEREKRDPEPEAAFVEAPPKPEEPVWSRPEEASVVPPYQSQSQSDGQPTEEPLAGNAFRPELSETEPPRQEPYVQGNPGFAAPSAQEALYREPPQPKEAPNAQPFAYPYPPQTPPENGQPYPCFWPVVPPSADGQPPAGWLPPTGQPVFIPVYLAPYAQPGDASETGVPYPYPYAPFQAAMPPAPPEPPHRAEGTATPTAAPAQPWPAYAPPEPTASFQEEAPAVSQPDEDMDGPVNGDGGADAVPSEAMASPVPVALTKLDFSAPPKRRVWPWIALLVLIVLAAVAFGLWKTGLYKKLPIPGLAGLLSPQATVEPVAEPSAEPLAAADPAVLEFTVDDASTVSPADLVFTVITNQAVKQIRLMNDTGLPLPAQITSYAEADGLKWNCQVSFATAYRGNVTAFICGEGGTWHDGGVKVAIEVE